MNIDNAAHLAAETEDEMGRMKDLHATKGMGRRQAEHAEHMTEGFAPSGIVAVRRALGAMPYLPVAYHGRAWMGVETFDHVADILRSLGDYLEQHAEEVRAMEDELRGLRSDVAATRRVLGLVPA